MDGYDRNLGLGVGHVLVMTRSGELLEDLTLGEGDLYHPGGMDFDGDSVWVPVAEYRVVRRTRRAGPRLDPCEGVATAA